MQRQKYKYKKHKETVETKLSSISLDPNTDQVVSFSAVQGMSGTTNTAKSGGRDKNRRKKYKMLLPSKGFWCL
jgi:hypothetical protein